VFQVTLKVLRVVKDEILNDCAVLQVAAFLGELHVYIARLADELPFKQDRWLLQVVTDVPIEFLPLKDIAVLVGQRLVAQVLVDSPLREDELLLLTRRARALEALSQDISVAREELAGEQMTPKALRALRDDLGGQGVANDLRPLDEDLTWTRVRAQSRAGPDQPAVLPVGALQHFDTDLSPSFPRVRGQLEQVMALHEALDDDFPLLQLNAVTESAQDSRRDSVDQEA